MAKNIRAITKSDIGLSTTGISGPNNESLKKQTGIVFIGFSTKNKNLVKKFIFNVERNTHREMTAISALNLVRLNILNT